MISVKVFDPKDYEISVWGTRYSDGNNLNLRTVEQWAYITKALHVFNFAFFNMNTAENRARGCAGRTLQYCSNPQIGEIGYDDIQGGRTILATLNSGCKFRGYGNIVLDNKIQGGLYSNKTSRNFNGFTADGRYIHVTASANTEYTVATRTISEVKKYGTTVKYLFREDGGGSASEYSSISKLAYYPQGVRAVPTVICIKRKENYKPYVFTRTLHIGCRGDDVKILQQALGGIEVDGIFGIGTLNRLKQAQKNNGLVADGYFGPLSAKAFGFDYQKK